MTDHLFLVGVAAAFLFSAAAVGRQVGARLLGSPDRALLALAAPVLGLALLAIISFGLLSIGGVPPWVHLVVPGVGLLLGVRVRQQLETDIRALRAEFGTTWWAAVAVISLVGIFLVAFALGPVVDWDSLSFHDRVPGQLLRARALIVPDDNLHVAQIGMMHLAGIPLRAAGAAGAVALLSVAMTLALILAGGLLAGRIGGTAGALLGVAGLAGTPLLLLVGMTPRVDAPLALAILVATAAWVSDLRDNRIERTGWVLALLGCAAAIKFQGIAYAALAVPMVIWTARKHLHGCMWGLALAAAVSLPYLIPNVIHFGSPFYPFFATPHLEPWLVGALGTSELPATTDLRFLEVVSSSRQDFNVWSFFLNPGPLTIEAEGVWYRPSLLLLLLPVSVWYLSRRVALAFLLPPILYTVTVLAVSSTTNLRYLLPTIIPLTVATAAGLGSMVSRIPLLSSMKKVLVGAFVLAAGFPGLRFVSSWNSGAALEHLVGIADDVQFQADHPDPTVRGFAHVPGWVTGHLTGEALLLLLFEARGGAFGPRVLADSRTVHWPIMAQTSLAERCLAGTGVTHVLLNVGAVDYYVRRGASGEMLKLPDLAGFASRCLSPIEQRNGFQLFSVSSTAPSRSTGEGLTP